jgi:transcriptional regulator with XRE-family HTH domain
MAGRRFESRREYTAWRARQIAYGRWAPWADAGPVRAHVRRLREAGLSFQAIAAAAGVSTPTVRSLMHGQPAKGRPAPARIHATRANSLLAVTADGVGQGRRVASGSQLRLRALVAIGHPPADLAARIGVPPQQLWSLIRGELRTVSAGVHAAVCGLYEQLWDTRPLARTAREQKAASAARRRAEREGWPPPMALDDDRLDDPAYRPRARWRPAYGVSVVSPAPLSAEEGAPNGQGRQALRPVGQDEGASPQPLPATGRRTAQQTDREEAS